MTEKEYFERQRQRQEMFKQWVAEEGYGGMQGVIFPEDLLGPEECDSRPHQLSDDDLENAYIDQMNRGDM